MKFNWKNWNLGGKIIFTSLIIALLSMLFNWVDLGIVSQTGLSQGGFLILLFWIYPVLNLLKNNDIKRLWGLVCSIGSLGSTLAYILSKTVELFGKTINAAGSGAYLFAFASLLLVIGVLKYTPVANDEKNVEQDNI